MFTKIFWSRAAERALKSFAQGGIMVLGTDAVHLVGFDSWQELLVIPTGMAVLSVLASIASRNGGDPENPSAIE